MHELLGNYQLGESHYKRGQGWKDPPAPRSGPGSPVRPGQRSTRLGPAASMMTIAKIRQATENCFLKNPRNYHSKHELGKLAQWRNLEVNKIQEILISANKRFVPSHLETTGTDEKKEKQFL